MERKRAVLYARTSRADTNKNLADQLALCREYAIRKGYAILGEKAEDDKGASGADIDLPQLTRVRDMAQAQEFDVLIVRDLDRLSRSLVKQLIVENELLTHNVLIEYVLGDFDNTPEGRLQKHIRATVAEFEREKTKERTRRGIDRAARQGTVMTGGKPPYGYRLTTTPTGNPTLIPDEQEARWVRQIYAWLTVDKLSCYQIAIKLTDLQVPTWSDRPGAKVSWKQSPPGTWSHRTVSRMVQSRTYKGEWVFNRNTDREIVIQVPPLVDPQTWQRAQQRFSKNKAQSPGNAALTYLLPRRLTCGQCGYKLYINTVRKQRQGIIHTYAYYQCPTRNDRDKNRPCALPIFPTTQVDQPVWDWIEYLLFNTPEILQEAAQLYAATPDNLTNRLKVLDTLITEQQQEWDNLVTTIKYVEGQAKAAIGVDLKRAQDTLNRLHAEKQSALDQADQHAQTADLWLSMDTVLSQWTEDIKDLRNSPTRKRRLVETLDLTGTLYPDYIDLNHCLTQLPTPPASRIDLQNVGQMTCRLTNELLLKVRLTFHKGQNLQYVIQR